MKIKKLTIKFFIVILIQNFLTAQFVWCGEFYSTNRQANNLLSPKINISAISLQGAYLQSGIFSEIDYEQIGWQIKSAFLALCGYSPTYAELKALTPAWNPLTLEEEKNVIAEIKQILLEKQIVSVQRIQEIVHQQVIDSRMKNFKSISAANYPDEYNVAREAIKSLETDYGSPGEFVADVLSNLLTQGKVYIVDGLPQEIVAHPGKQGIYFGTGDKITVEQVIHEAIAYCFEIDHKKNIGSLKAETLTMSLMPNRSSDSPRDFAMGKTKTKLPKWFKNRDTASPYEILGLEEKNISPEEIKKAYRKMSMQYHPDRNMGSKDFEEAFKSVQNAYEFLLNPENQKEADQPTAEEDTYYPDIDISSMFDANKREREMTLAELRSRGLTPDAWGSRNLSDVFWLGDRIFMNVRYPNPVAFYDAANRASYHATQILSFTASQIGHWDFDCYTSIYWAQSPDSMDIFASPKPGEYFIANNGVGILVNLSEENKETVIVDLKEYAELFSAHKDKLSAAIFPHKGTRGLIAFFDLSPESEAFSKDGNNLVFLTRTGIVINWDIAQGQVTQSNLDFPNSQPQYGSFIRYGQGFSQNKKKGEEFIAPIYWPEVALSPNGTLAMVWYQEGISENDRNPFIEVWDVNLNKRLARLPVKYDRITNARWDDNGNIKIYSEMLGFQLWDWATDTLTYKSDEVKEIKSPNGLYSAKVDEAGKLQITNVSTGGPIDHEVLFSYKVKYDRLAPDSPIMPELNTNAQLIWNANSSQMLIELQNKVIIVGLQIKQLDKNVPNRTQETLEFEFASFIQLIRERFQARDEVSFADIGSGPVGEFGKNLKIVLSQNKISVSKDSVSIDNALVDKKAMSEGHVQLADIESEKDRQRTGLGSESKDIVFVNNIVNYSLLRSAVLVLKENGLLMITFALSDLYDAPNMAENCKTLLNNLSKEDPEYEYHLLGKDGKVKMPADYPTANQLYSSQDTMLVVEKIRKVKTNALTVKESSTGSRRSKQEWLKDEILQYFLEADRLGSSWRLYNVSGEDDILTSVLSKQPDLIKDIVARFLELMKSPHPDAVIQERMLSRLIQYIAEYREKVDTDVILECIKIPVDRPGWGSILSDFFQELIKRIDNNKTTDKELDELINIILPAEANSVTEMEALGSPLRMQAVNKTDTQRTIAKLLAAIVINKSELRSAVLNRMLKIELTAPAVAEALQNIVNKDAAILASYADKLSGKILTDFFNQCSKQNIDVSEFNVLKKRHYSDWKTVMDVDLWGQEELEVFMSFISTSSGPGYYVLYRGRNKIQKLEGLKFTHDNLSLFIHALHNVPWQEKTNHKEAEYKSEVMQWIKFLIVNGIVVQTNDLSLIINALNNVDPVLPYERQIIFETLKQILIRQPELAGQYLQIIEQLKHPDNQARSFMKSDIKKLNDIINRLDIKKNESVLEQAI